MTVPLCTGCKWVVARKDATPAYLCIAPRVDPVTGSAMSSPPPLECAMMRTAYGECGPAGALWAAP